MNRDYKLPHQERFSPGQQRQAHVNAIIPEAAGFNPKEPQNLKGTLMLFYIKVKVLFDTGASNSFIASSVV